MSSFQHFGEALSFYRRRMKITLRQFSKQIGYSASYVSEVENNKGGAFSDEILKKIKKLLKLNQSNYNEMCNLAKKLTKLKKEKKNLYDDIQYFEKEEEIHLSNIVSLIWRYVQYKAAQDDKLAKELFNLVNNKL